MRLAAFLLLVVTLVSSCSNDGKQRATPKPTTSTTSTTTAADDCPTTPQLPPAADGSPSQLVATVGNVQIAIVDHGASVDVVSLFVEVDCRLAAVTLSGEPTTIPIGGTVTHGDGLACHDGMRFEVLTATSDDGATYQATSATYRLDGTELVEIDRSASTIEAQTDPDVLSTYYRLDC